MPRGDLSGFDAYARMIASRAPERAIQYRQEAERLRQMAETQGSDDLRLLDIAKQYEDLANSLASSTQG